MNATRTIRIILITCIAVPVVLFLFMFAALGFNDIQNGRKAGAVEDILNKIDIATNITVFKNGDGLTGNGAGFSFDVDQTYTSPASAEAAILTELIKTGLIEEGVFQQKYLLGTTQSGATGGDTVIAKIDSTYYDNGSGSIRFQHTLVKETTCKLSGNSPVCGPKNTTRKEYVEELYERGAVSEVRVSGNLIR